ncbi:helix-turn-helix domain-containing protein [Allosaccharopolyspora coralli]|uniref:Helix-turn-helix domain-containing protein n=2 Tax=Allosaccharopolyspora coralli TaxID=2665642 RepID=A0A5Q3QE67_9PSEU|nr:helix-turn-helix domain-containing protein [Allosaccharopolyspora coralli]
MGGSELARHLGLAVPTTHRLVAAMVEHGLLRRDSHGHHPGWRFTSSTLVTVAYPVVEALRRETGESAQVWVRRGEQRLCGTRISTSRKSAPQPEHGEKLRRSSLSHARPGPPLRTCRYSRRPQRRERQAGTPVSDHHRRSKTAS